MRDFARRLRRHSTDAEKLLWSRLRGRRLRAIKFKRQVPLFGYVVDFAALENKLIIERDGGQHAMQAERDKARTVALENAGYRVIRFWNNEVLSNLDGVLESIVQELSLAH